MAHGSRPGSIQDKVRGTWEWLLRRAVLWRSLQEGEDCMMIIRNGQVCSVVLIEPYAFVNMASARSLQHQRMFSEFLERHGFDRMSGKSGLSLWSTTAMCWRCDLLRFRSIPCLKNRRSHSDCRYLKPGLRSFATHWILQSSGH